MLKKQAPARSKALAMARHENTPVTNCVHDLVHMHGEDMYQRRDYEDVEKGKVKYVPQTQEPFVRLQFGDTTHIS
jgi:hypothetical protein